MARPRQREHSPLDSPLDAESESDSSCSLPSVTPSEERWRRRWVFGREGNEDTLWHRLVFRAYTGYRDWDVTEDGWQPLFGWPPLVLLGAHDEGNEGRMALVHVPWAAPPLERTPACVTTLADVRADTPLTPAAPALGEYDFRDDPELRAWAFADAQPNKRTRGRYCCHRLDYGACGRDVVQVERELGRLLVACDGPKWEALGEGRKWTWLRRAHARRALRRGLVVAPSRRKMDQCGDERASDSGEDDGGFAGD